MKINYLSYDDRLRKQQPIPESESISRMNKTMLNERSSVNKDEYNGSNMRNKSNVAAINFGGKISKMIYNNKLFNDLLIGFEKKTALAQNGVALVVAGGLRPATNIAMASDKDREDCVHAATHSISSALVGFGVTCSVMKPFTDAVQKFKDNPGKYLPESMAEYYKIGHLGARRVQGSGRFKATCKMTEMIPEIIIGVPKAMLTIALIPPLLKYCFGIEKKKKGEKQQEIPNTEINKDSIKETKEEAQKVIENDKNSPNFEGVKRPRNFWKEMQVRQRKAEMYYHNTVVEGIAKNYFGKTMESKPMKWLGQATENLWIDAVELCSIVNSLIISTLYTVRTLQNPNLKEDKRRTLAVNDVLTFLVSTAVSLTANKSLAKYWNKVTHNYAAAQFNLEPAKLQELIKEANEATHIVDGKEVKKYANGIRNAEDFVREAYKDFEPKIQQIKGAKILEGSEGAKNLNFKIKGMGIVKTLFVFGMVYRYIVPVFVMKPANKLGEKLNAHIQKKEEKKLAKLNEEIAEKKAEEVKLQALKDLKIADVDDLDDIEDLVEDLDEKGLKLVPKNGNAQTLELNTYRNAS